MNLLKNIQSTIYYLFYIDLSNPSELQTNMHVFKKHKMNVDLIEEFEEASLIDCLKKTPRNSNILIAFSGSQILSRFSSSPSESLFDEINEDEFYLRSVTTLSGFKIQSVCRKKIIDSVIELLEKSKLFMLDFSFSPCVIPILEDHLEKQHLQVDHLIFEFSDYQLTNIKETSNDKIPSKKQIKINIEGSQFSTVGLTLLATLLHFFKYGPDNSSALDFNNTQSKYLRLFKNLSVIFLTSLFILLLSNYFLFSSIKNKIIELKQSGITTSSKISEINKLETQISEFKKLFDNSNEPNKIVYAFYLDHIALLRSSTIWFNSIVIHPVFNRQETDKPINFQNSLITITGEVNIPATLNKFIYDLNQEDWVKDIELKNYQSSSEKTYADFTINLLK